MAGTPATNVYGGTSFVTTLGISKHLRVRLPLQKVPGHFLFQTPAQYLGEYETLELCRLLSPFCETFVDIGANWGFYTYYVSATTQTPVHFIEPNPGLFSFTQSNCGKGGLPNYVGHDIAISDVEDFLKFYINETDDHMSSLMPLGEGHAAREIKVQVLSFEKWALREKLEQKNLMVKVDVEQAEWNFVRGVGKLWPQISCLVMEVLGDARQSGLVNHFIDHVGMNAYYINGFSLEPVRADDNRYTAGQFNWLFCRDNPDGLRAKLTGSKFQVRDYA